MPESAASAYVTSLPLAERLYRRDPALASSIYSEQVLTFLRDGVVILPGAVELESLDALDQDLHQLAASKADPILGGIEIDGPEKYYRSRYLRNLAIDDFRQEPPGLKLVDLQRFYDSARRIAFSQAAIAFLEELFGAPPALIQSLTFWKSSEQPIHQDFSYVHHHRKLGELAAAWIPLEDIHPDSGPLVYYKGSHRPDQLGFFDWGEGSILASREADHEVFNAYTHHLRRLVEQNALQPSIFLPKRGDLLIWHGALIHGGTPMRNPAITRRSFVCHYTTVASHKKAQAFRVAEGFSFDSPPQPLFQRSLPGRLKARLLETLAGFRS
ncbi:MAG: phytanoyl-CoA dioxygenase family protein [Cyanobacteriota bacterium]|nr:phytanoyl-CoA dioxygenase family protein [Cyanobacteriota bacterium]